MFDKILNSEITLFTPFVVFFVWFIYRLYKVNKDFLDDEFNKDWE